MRKASEISQVKMCTFEAQCIRDTRLDNGGGKFDIFLPKRRRCCRSYYEVHFLRSPRNEAFLCFLCSKQHTSQFRTITANSCTNQIKTGEKCREEGRGILRIFRHSLFHGISSNIFMDENNIFRFYSLAYIEKDVCFPACETIKRWKRHPQNKLSTPYDLW